MEDAAQNPDLAVTRRLLLDSFSRVFDHAKDVTADVPATVADRRIVPDANTIGWLVWHSARVIDAQLAPLAKAEEVWITQGWFDRFGLDLPAGSTGYGHTRAEAAKVHASEALLMGYFADVEVVVRDYLDRVTSEELERVIDSAWDPPVTVGVRLVSIIDDCVQHLGAAAYLVGVFEH